MKTFTNAHWLLGTVQPNPVYGRIHLTLAELRMKSDNAGNGPPKQKTNPAPSMTHHKQTRATIDKSVMPSTGHTGKMDNAGKPRPC